MNKLVYAELNKKGEIDGLVVTTLADAQKLREVEGVNLKATLIPWDGLSDDEREARTRAEYVQATKYRKALKEKKVISYENPLQYANAYKHEVEKLKKRA